MICKRCITCDRPMDDEGDFIDCMCSECVWHSEDEQYDQDWAEDDDDERWPWWVW